MTGRVGRSAGRRPGAGGPRARAGRTVPALLLALLAALPARAQQPAATGTERTDSWLPTPGERSGYLAFTRHAEMTEFLDRLADRSPAVELETVAGAAAGPEGGETRSIALARIRYPDARAAAAGRPVVLVLAAQHGDEQSGKEAALRLARELALGELRGLLAELGEVLILPMLNPWGVERDIREDAVGLDLNRDHLLLRSPATRAVHRLFARHRPHVVLDLHELGPSGYDVQVGVPTHPNAEPARVAYARFLLLPSVARELAERSLTFREYVVPVAPAGASDPAATAAVEGGQGVEGAAGHGDEEPRPIGAAGGTPGAAAGSPGEAGFWTHAPMEANNARNAFALHGALAFLLEAASSRGIEGLEARTETHYLMVRAFLEAIASRGEEIVRLVAGEGEIARLVRPAARVVALEARYEADPARPALTRRVRGPTGSVVLETTDRWRPLVRPTRVIPPAAAYLLAPGETELVHLLLRHGVRVERLAGPLRARVGRYPVPTPAAARPRGDPGPPADLGALVEWAERDLEEGCFLVPAAGSDSLLIATLLEPWSAEGWYRTVGAAGGAPPEGGGYYPLFRLEAFEGSTHPYRPE